METVSPPDVLVAQSCPCSTSCASGDGKEMPGTNSAAGNDWVQHSLLHLWPFQAKQEGDFILREVFTTVDVFDRVFFPPYLLSMSLVFIPDFKTTAALIGNAFCNRPHSYESNTYKYLYLFFQRQFHLAGRKRVSCPVSFPIFKAADNCLLVLSCDTVIF